MDNFMKYLNTSQQKILENFSYINDKIDLVLHGDHIKYIKKKNLQFRHGGIVSEVINNTIVIKNIRYKYSYTINTNDHIIFHKSKYNRKNKNRDFMEYILNGLDSNTIKVTKKIKI